MSNTEIVMYVRRFYCPGVALARDLMQRYNIPYREINIDTDSALADRVKIWTGGFLSVPTIVIANQNEDLPYTEILPLPETAMPGYDRGPLITEPTNQQLEDWLHKHGFLNKPYTR